MIYLHKILPLIFSPLFFILSIIIFGLIISSKKLKPGSGGIAGGGIYLPTNPNDTMHKAHNFGFLFKVKAKLGNVQKWSPNTI